MKSKNITKNQKGQIQPKRGKNNSNQKQIINLNSNYLAIAQNENGTNTSVIVRGKRGILRNITGNSDECNKDNCITAEIDLAGYTSGYYDIPVVFKTENRDIEIIDDEQVFVKVLVRSR